MRYSQVFNQDQVIGVKVDKPSSIADPVRAMAKADHFVANTEAMIRHEGDRAYFNLRTDEIVMPEASLFVGTTSSTPTDSYYSVLFHELIHWSGHSARCDRDQKGKFGTEAYAIEELVAELGAAFLCAEQGISNAPRQDHADYINQWIEVLEENDKAIFWAASKASQAVRFLNSLSASSCARDSP